MIEASYFHCLLQQSLGLAVPSVLSLLYIVRLYHEGELPSLFVETVFWSHITLPLSSLYCILYDGIL